MIALAAHWLPGQEPDEETMGQALFLERNYWKNMEVAVSNGIVKALKG